MNIDSVDFHQLGSDLLRDWYQSKWGWQWSQYVGAQLPEDARGQEWADEFADRAVREFYQYQNPDTGLVPVGGDKTDNRWYCCRDFHTISPLNSIAGITKLVFWHNRPHEIERARVFAANVLQKHSAGQLGDGWYYGVDVRTAAPACDAIQITQLGGLHQALRRLQMDSDAESVRRFVKSNMALAELEFFPTRWTAYGPVGRDRSSDGCYFVRALGDTAERRKWAESYSESFFTSVDHSVNHLGDITWYSDGIMNQLLMHILAERWDRFDACVRVIERESIDGLCPRMIAAGRAVETKIHEEQATVLYPLVVAAQQTRNAAHVSNAARYASRLVSIGYRTRPELLGACYLALGRLLKNSGDTQ